MFEGLRNPTNPHQVSIVNASYMILVHADASVAPDGGTYFPLPFPKISWKKRSELLVILAKEVYRTLNIPLEIWLNAARLSHRGYSTTANADMNVQMIPMTTHVVKPAVP